MYSLIHSSAQTVHQPTCSFLCFLCDTWFCQLFAAQYSLWIGKYCKTVSMCQIIALQHRPPSTSHITLPLKSEFTFCVITEQSIPGVFSPTNLSFVFLAIQISFSCQPNKAPKASIIKLTIFTGHFCLGLQMSYRWLAGITANWDVSGYVTLEDREHFYHIFASFVFETLSQNWTPHWKQTYVFCP